MLPRSICAVLALAAVPAALFGAQKSSPGRTTVSLDGTWDVADSLDAKTVPASYSHKAPVPGLANLATPAFADVDKFDSRELIDVEIRDKQRPESERTKASGTPHQNRNYFWYRRTFRLPEKRQTAILQINKAQFGTAVWVNGKPAGEHYGCFSATILDVTNLLRWDGENEIVVRIGAHPAALPAWVPAGTDKEKYKWTPGIYDSVSIALSDNPVIETIQVAPRLATSEIVVQTVLRNTGSAAAAVSLRQTVHAWKDAQVVARNEQPPVQVGPGEQKTITTTLRLPNARLWTPETPNLYVLDSSTGGDSTSTRFGMREFRFDTATKRAYLNGKMYFLRGSNIALHRFFEDPECKDRPWNEAWVRKLLVDGPKKMHWNSFRLTLGAVPQFWLDIADEAGLLMQSEFPIWQGHWDEWRVDELETEFREWMRDQWNHPSLAIWDASNETHADVLREKVIPVVRRLDLSDRPWDNGYTLPEGPNDMVEDHPYLFIGWWKPTYKPFEIPDLEKMTAVKTDWNSPHPTSHAFIVNEYGWLWLNRDGSPTLLTDKVYQRLMGGPSTPEQRFEAYGYMLGGLTEFWRAHRNAAGVQHFVYLTCSYPRVKTSDNFRDVASLEFEPHFADYVGEAFRPLGLYINFWQPSLKLGEDREYAVMMVNDEAEEQRGTLKLTFEKDGVPVKHVEVPFTIPGYGQQTWPIHLQAPSEPGKYLLKAVAEHGGAPTVSRRKVEVK